MANINQIAEKTREILLSDWDPIGINDVPQAQDEYDAYVPLIARHVLYDTSVAALAEHLLSIETKEMGMPGNRQRASHVASLLISLK